MIRIISGKNRGRKIRAPKNLPVRPTTDRAKESLFNILANHFSFPEIQAMDLFSGTGNISYELASRGCMSIRAVDESRICTSFISQTTEALDMPQVDVVRSEVLTHLRREYLKYDLIFADPPYDYTSYAELLDLVVSKALLQEDGLLVIEHQSRVSLADLPNFLFERKYGNVAFSFFSATDVN